jgi:hypothetical protein
MGILCLICAIFFRNVTLAQNTTCLYNLAALSPQKEGHAACMNEMKMHKKFQSGKYDFGHLSVDWRITQSSILQEQDIQRYGLIKQAQDNVLCYDLEIVLNLQNAYSVGNLNQMVLTQFIR